MFALAQRVALSVHERFGVWLEPEARIVGARWDAPGARRVRVRRRARVKRAPVRAPMNTAASAASRDRAVPS